MKSVLLALAITAGAVVPGRVHAETVLSAPFFWPLVPSHAAADLRISEPHAIACDVGQLQSCREASKTVAAGAAALGARYRASCDAGSPSDCVRASAFLPRDAPDAAALLTRACDRRVLQGCWELAEWSRIFASRSRHPYSVAATAVAAYDHACRANILLACIRLAEMRADGFGTDLDLDGALAMLAPLCSAGEQKACDAARTIECVARGQGPACNNDAPLPDAERPLAWARSEAAAFARARRERRGVLIELYDDASPVSRILAAELRRADVSTKVDWIAVRVDVTRPGPARDRAIARLDIAPPALLFFTPERKEVSRIVRLIRGNALVVAVPWVAP